MKKCLLCEKETKVFFGDGGEYGESFCRECYEQNICTHCKKMNIVILTEDMKINNHKKYSPPKDNEKYDVLYLSFHGRIFAVFCKDCKDSGDPYKEELIASENYGCEVPEFDSELEDNINENQEDESTNIDAYYIRRGKHDLY